MTNSQSPSLVERAIEDAVKTVADPSVANIVSDIELAISLVKQLKTLLSDAHPSLTAVVKALFE